MTTEAKAEVQRPDEAEVRSRYYQVVGWLAAAVQAGGGCESALVEQWRESGMGIAEDVDRLTESDTP